ncbi:MAG: hypothetical protein FADNKDHG_01550 [Holosporales bacterium]
MHLILDRTNWKFGKQDINYLVLAVRIDNIVFPLFWTMIDHQGNSEQQNRIELLNQFKEVFGLKNVESLSADREFIGKDWIAFLLKNNVPFVIRVKENMLVNFGKNAKLPVKDFLSHLDQDQTRATSQDSSMIARKTSDALKKSCPKKQQEKRLKQIA